MKKTLKIAFISLVFAIAILLLNETNAANLNVDVNFDGEKIKMTSQTPDMTWNINNLLPGEKDETILTVNNTGKKQVDVKFIANLVEGKELADVLDIKIIKLASEVNKKEDEFFNGKYSELENISIQLESEKTQSFKIITSLPKETGNEYQNKACKVKLNFVATGYKDKEPSKPEPKPEQPPEKVETEEIVPPTTGEGKVIYIVVGVLVVAVVGFAISFVASKKKKK